MSEYKYVHMSADTSGGKKESVQCPRAGVHGLSTRMLRIEFRNLAKPQRHHFSSQYIILHYH